MYGHINFHIECSKEYSVHILGASSFVFRSNFLLKHILKKTIPTIHKDMCLSVAWIKEEDQLKTA